MAMYDRIEKGIKEVKNFAEYEELKNKYKVYIDEIDNIIQEELKINKSIKIKIIQYKTTEKNKSYYDFKIKK